ncbi:uncharacterized protein LOC133722773 [Rosa rugosa]|uniref:uncharacterized protein LOC133722773 n=1 Tax=Rosa rugosa TaxID=74645 RepID=UPI002B404201|nr:uncharacterized protein LOC133722773 [Rosa rugosa]
MRFGHMLVDKPYGLTTGVNIIRHRIYPFREGEKRWLPLMSMILPVSIRCTTCANHMPQGTTLTYVRRRALSKTSLGAPIVTFFFNCTKCRANIQMKEDPENSGHVVEDGAAEIFEHEKSEHLGKIGDEDGLDHETSYSNLKKSGHRRKIRDGGGLDYEASDSDLKRQKLMIGLPSNPTDVFTISDSSSTEHLC